MRCALKILEDFKITEGKSGKSQLKPEKSEKTHLFLGFYNLRLKARILIEMIVKHLLIIAYYM